MISTIAGHQSTTNASAARYNYIHGNGDSWDATITNRDLPCPCEFTVTKAAIRLSASPGSSRGYTFTLYKNGSSTAATITISDANTTGTYTGTAVSFAEGDTIAWHCSPTNTPSTRLVQTAIEVSTNGNYQPLFGGYTTGPGNAAQSWNGLQRAFTWVGSVADHRTPMPAAGTISKLKVVMASAPGTGKSFQYSIIRSGVTEALSVTIADAATSASDLVNTVSCSLGDTVSITCTPSGTPTTSKTSWVSVFTPTTPGESIYLFSNASNTDVTGFSYNGFVGRGYGAWNSTETNVPMITTATTVARYYASLNDPPQGTDSYVFYLRKNGSDQAGSVSIVGSAQAGNSAPGFTTALGDLLIVKCSAVSTPAAANYAGGIAFYTPYIQSVRHPFINHSNPGIL